KPFAVVELFTSEGCSSCPPADRLLTGLVTDANAQNVNLYALSFHVNYWDYLGWKDPFAQQGFTNRQRNYARRLGSGVYTPQMVVNGKAEFVGSNRQQAAQSINQALENDKSPVKIEDLTISKTRDKLSIGFEVAGNGKGKVAHIALVEKELEIAVERGENRGRKLHHDNVVRLFKSLSISNGDSFETSMTLPKVINTEQSTIIVYLQDNESLKVYDAAGGKW
ncbi:MAG: DUF1223 domain-containing protein, partial [Bacteroidota bacterium]